MFKTTVFRSTKSVFHPFHHPLPLSKQEQQKLLKVLTTSFRKHLDKEHGPLARTATPFNDEGHRRPSPTSDQPDQSAVDRHLRAILSNPLFSYSSQNEVEGRLRPQSRDPKDIFDEGVSRGTMTLSGASGFLQAVQANIVQSASLSRTDATAESSAGLRVLRWLRASGQERDLAFIANKRFARLLLSFMIAEGLEGVAWTWLQRLARHEVATSPDLKPVSLLSGTLLALLVDAKKGDEQNLDAAYSAVLRGDEILNQSSIGQQSMEYPWSKLSWTSTVDAWKRPSPSSNLYDSFVAISEHLRRDHALDKAHLDIHHPTRADPSLAMAYLGSKGCQEALDERRRVASHTAQGQASATALRLYYWTIRTKSLALDTVNYLVDTGSSRELADVMDVVRTRLVSIFTDLERKKLEEIGSNLTT